MRVDLVAAKTDKLRKKTRRNQQQQVILHGVCMYVCMSYGMSYDGGGIEMGRGGSRIKFVVGALTVLTD